MCDYGFDSHPGPSGSGRWAQCKPAAIIGADKLILFVDMLQSRGTSSKRVLARACGFKARLWCESATVMELADMPFNKEPLTIIGVSEQ